MSELEGTVSVALTGAAGNVGSVVRRGFESVEEVDEVVSLEDGALWAPCGDVSGVAVMESASE